MRTMIHDGRCHWNVSDMCITLKITNTKTKDNDILTSAAVSVVFSKYSFKLLVSICINKVT